MTRPAACRLTCNIPAAVAALVVSALVLAPGVVHAQSRATVRPSLPRPEGMTVKVTGATSLAVAWQPVRSAGVKDYEVYVNRRLLGVTRRTHRQLEQLRCATSYVITVRTRDRSRHHSFGTSLRVRTAACPAAVAPVAVTAPPVAAAPTAPVGVGATSLLAPTPFPATDCPADPLKGSPSPASLTVLDPASPCRNVTGTVVASQVITPDRCRLLLAPDPDGQALLNDVNISALSGELPSVMGKQPTQPVPAPGSSVLVFGAWVNDTSPGAGYNAIDPAWEVKQLTGATAPCGT